MYIFGGFFLISPYVWPNSGFWCCVFLTLPITLFCRTIKFNLLGVGYAVSMEGKFSIYWLQFLTHCPKFSPNGNTLATNFWRSSKLVTWKISRRLNNGWEFKRCCRMYANLEKFAHPFGGDQEMSSRKWSWSYLAWVQISHPSNFLSFPTWVHFYSSNLFYTSWHWK
jgi:hypothetical protein